MSGIRIPTVSVYDLYPMSLPHAHHLGAIFDTRRYVNTKWNELTKFYEFYLTGLKWRVYR